MKCAHMPFPWPLGKLLSTEVMSWIQLCCPDVETATLGSVSLTPEQVTGQSVSATTISFPVKLTRLVSDDLRAASVAPES